MSTLSGARFGWAMATTLLCSMSSHAGVKNDVPSCYVANKINYEKPPVESEFFVVVDQTTLFDAELKKSIKENLWDNLLPNSSFTIIRFSAFSQGHYTEVGTTGTIDPPMPEKVRNDTGVKVLGRFDACMTGQLKFAREIALTAVTSSLSDASADLAKSDILAALQDVSARVRASAAQRKVVLIASDMLENSSVSSFYASSTKVRKIDPSHELAIAERANLIGDFGGNTFVHVVGAGLIGPSGDRKASYREPQTLRALEAFWQRYLEKSGARLEQFGTPALLKPVR